MDGGGGGEGALRLVSAKVVEGEISQEAGDRGLEAWPVRGFQFLSFKGAPSSLPTFF